MANRIRRRWYLVHLQNTVDNRDDEAVKVYAKNEDEARARVEATTLGVVSERGAFAGRWTLGIVVPAVGNKTLVAKRIAADLRDICTRTIGPAELRVAGLRPAKPTSKSTSKPTAAQRVEALIKFAEKLCETLKKHVPYPCLVRGQVITTVGWSQLATLQRHAWVAVARVARPDLAKGVRRRDVEVYLTTLESR